MKLFLILLLSIGGSGSVYACGSKDYQCLKQKYQQEKSKLNDYSNRYSNEYNYNQKIFVHGKYDSTPVEINGKYNHNIRVYANNTEVIGGNDASVINVDKNSYRNKITINASGIIRNEARSIVSMDTCVALICDRSHSNQGVIVNINNANISNTVR